MTDVEALRELLERAAALEAKAEPLVEAAPVDDAATVAELAAKVAELEDALFAMQNSSDPGVDPVADAEAADGDGLDDEGFGDLDGFDGDGLDDEGFGDDDVETPLLEVGDVADEAEPVGVDFEEPDGPADQQLKAAGFDPCPACGSAAADVYADGTARCEDCGMPLSGTEGKGLDFDDDGEGFVADFADETKDLEGGSDTLSEIELLMARRAELDA
jgi:hypothetical protein